jgi:predicted PurR-regulated permease PerM
MMLNQKAIERGAGIALIAALFLGCILVLRPFISALLWAAILCLATWPIYETLARRLGGRRTLAAFLMTLILLLVLFLPFVLVGFSYADNIRDAIQWINRFSGDTAFDTPPEWLANIPYLGHKVSEHWGEFSANSERIWKSLRPWLNKAGGWVLQHSLGFAQGLFMMGISLLVVFFFYRDGQKVVDRIRRGFGQLIGETGQHLLDVAAKTVRSVVYGMLGTGLAQAAMAWIGFVIAGVPGAPLLSLLTFFFSILPFGPPILWGGAAIWLFNHGEMGWGIFMIVYGILGISSIDNVVKPYLISRGSRLPFALMLLGVLGGILTFGFIGVFIGPTLLAVGNRLLLEFRWGQKERQEAGSPA